MHAKIIYSLTCRFVLDARKRSWFCCTTQYSPGPADDHSWRNCHWRIVSDQDWRKPSSLTTHCWLSFRATFYSQDGLPGACGQVNTDSDLIVGCVSGMHQNAESTWNNSLCSPGIILAVYMRWTDQNYQHPEPRNGHG